MIAERPPTPPRPGSPLNPAAHRQAVRFAECYPDAERRRWAYTRMYHWALRNPEGRR